MDLFNQNKADDNPALTPLADRMRPATLQGFFGHMDILDEGKFLSRIIAGGDLSSVIFWGPPGSGKTTLARILAGTAEADFMQISAVDSGVKDVRSAIAKGKLNRNAGRATVLFIDEIHRFNKAQQDALLSSVENGILTLIGATTENPSFEVIAPLLSRTRVLKLHALDEADLANIFDRAIDEDDIIKAAAPKFDKKAREMLINMSGGDARKLLNSIEMCVKLADDGKTIDKEIAKEALLLRTANYDKDGEAHYDTISAFIKSIRGSDPDAGIYYLARMLNAGEDVKFIARRLVILASEDIGNADPFALVLANNAFSAVDRIGMPEARIILAQTVTYLASAPKSNASYVAIDEALGEVRSSKHHSIPLHLRNAPTDLMKDEGYGDGYQYAHNYEGHFAQQEYLPPELKDKIFYRPSEQGREGKIKARLEALWKKRRDEGAKK